MEKEQIKKLIKEELEKLSKQQLRIQEKNKGVVVLLEGWATAGKSKIINRAVDYIDPKFYNVAVMRGVSKNEIISPFTKKYFSRLPEFGSFVFFDSGWTYECVSNYVRTKDTLKLQQDVESINLFERQLRDNGYIVVKIFLDITVEEQQKRMKKLQKDPDTAWQVSKEDLYEAKHCGEFEETMNAVLKATHTSYSPWAVFNSCEKDMCVLNALMHINCVIDSALEDDYVPQEQPNKFPLLPIDTLDKVDLSLSLDDKEYKEKLKKLQSRLEKLQNKIYKEKIPVVIVYEGQDAAGKGGNIKRLTKSLHSRGFIIHPISAPTPSEKNRHHLWRFWTKIPKRGHIAIFDRSWYGRVMVERVEHFCSENDWARAFNEINEFEYEMAKWGAVVIKFWVQIDKDTQLERFNIRKNTPEKHWKITEEDWRNRDKWEVYEQVVDEMLEKTNTTFAPWYILESNDKKYARIKALEIVVDTLEQALKKIKNQ